MANMKQGKIIEPAGCNIHDHEQQTARALVNAGYTVRFIPESKRDGDNSPDILMNGELWEMKSPNTDKLNQIKNNLKRARRQSQNVIIDSQRVKYIPDQIIQKFLVARYKEQKTIKGLLFVNRKRKVIDITKLV